MSGDAGRDDEGAQGTAETPICSAKGCREAAVWALEWNNPRIHTPERRKRWLACEAHRAALAEYLDIRGFLRDIRPLTPS